MTSPLSPEAVAQMVATLRGPNPDVDAARDMLTTLAAENATLRASEAAALERAARIEKASSEFLEAYVDMINSGDCGNWDPEKEPLVIALRTALTPKADKE